MMTVRREKETAGQSLSRGRALLNEFVAACLDNAQEQLCTAGTVKETAHFGYGMKGEARDPGISQYELTQQETDEADEELEKIREYARKTGADAVAVVMDMGIDSVSCGIYPDSDGVLVVAGVSPDGQVGVIRPYKRSGKRIVFGEPNIMDGFQMPLIQGIF